MRSLILMATALSASPALAQHTGHEHHDMPGMNMPMPEAGRTETGSVGERADANSSAHRGHAMPMAEGGPVSAPPPAEALTGPAYAADAYFPAEEMHHARVMMAEEMGGIRTTMAMLDRLEIQSGKGADSWAWEGGIRTGGDIDRVWITSEGEGEIGGAVDDAELQAMWSHAIGPWFDLQAGARHQFLSGPDRTQLAVGVQGLAPYMFELSGTAYLSTKGELTGRIEADVDQRLTQRLILQPRIEANLSAQDIPDLGMGNGITSLQAGVRLRYELKREFAPYVGVEWQKEFGRTARYTQASGGDPDRVMVLIGLRAWF